MAFARVLSADCIPLTMVPSRETEASTRGHTGKADLGGNPCPATVLWAPLPQLGAGGSGLCHARLWTELALLVPGLVDGKALGAVRNVTLFLHSRPDCRWHLPHPRRCPGLVWVLSTYDVPGARKPRSTLHLPMRPLLGQMRKSRLDRAVSRPESHSSHLVAPRPLMPVGNWRGLCRRLLTPATHRDPGQSPEGSAFAEAPGVASVLWDPVAGFLVAQRPSPAPLPASKPGAPRSVHRPPVTGAQCWKGREGSECWAPVAGEDVGSRS